MKRVLFFLGHLNDRDVEWMINNGSKIEIEAGEALIRKDISIDNLYIVLSGELIVCKDTFNSNVIAKLGAGEVIGEMSFIESRPPSVSVFAKEPAVLYVISKKQINNRMSAHPEFRANFYYALTLFLSNRLRATTDQLGYGKAEEEDVIDTNILDGVSQAGSRFSQILHRFSEV